MLNKRDVDKLTAKEQVFVLEYLLDGNGMRAVMAAGYNMSGGAAKVYANKLLAKPRIKLLLDKLYKQQRKEFKIEADQILERLWFLCTRDPRKYLNDDAVLDAEYLKHELGDAEAVAIDGIKQKVLKRYTEEDGSTTEILETEIKLSPIATAIRMAMEHRGLFAPAQVEGRLTIDFDKLYESQMHAIDADPIELFIASEEKRLLGGSTASSEQ